MPPLSTRRPATRSRARSKALAAVVAASAMALMTALPYAAPSAAQAPAEAVKKPKLTVEERVYETGEIARDQVVDHSFKISNTGDAPLVIRDIVLPPNLEVVSRPASLAPGESGEIHVRVPLLFDRAEALLKQIALQTNDPDQPSYGLELKIFSTEYVNAKPGYARWISVQHEKPGTISQHLIATDKQDFEVLRTSPLPAGVTSKLAVDKTDSGKPRQWNLDLTLGEDAPVGAITGTLLVYVNHPKQSIVPIPLSGFMRPVAAVTPNMLNVGELTLPQKRTQAFTVKFFSTEPILVTKVEHDLKGFPPATLETRTAGRDYRVKLEFDPATMPKGALHGTLSIFTNSPKDPVLKVPIEGTIR